MRELSIILCSILLCVCSTQISAMDRKNDGAIIMINNAWSDKLTLSHACVYFYNSPWQDAVCQRLSTRHPAFVLPTSHKLSEIQRITVYGKNRYFKRHKFSVCLPYHNHNYNKAKKLTDNEKYIIMVNYVTGDDMVCSLYPENSGA